MKKTLSMLTAAVLMASSLSACGLEANDPGNCPGNGGEEQNEDPTGGSEEGGNSEETGDDEGGNGTGSGENGSGEGTGEGGSGSEEGGSETGSETGDSGEGGGSGEGSGSEEGGSETGGNEGSGTGSETEGSGEGEETEVTLDIRSHDIAAGDTADTNPLKGLIPFSGVSTFPHSMEWFYIAVNEVETAEGVYDWTALENRLDTIAGRGHQAVLRFYYDYPGEDTGVPQYLIDGGLTMRPYNEPSDLGGAGLCPDYSNSAFRQSMQDFIAAFGAEYDGDPRIGYITEGLLGFWGEWHNWPFDEDTSDGKPDWSIPAEVYSEVYSAYNDAFKTTGLIVREPKDGVDDPSFATGYHDDSFAYATLSAAKGGQDWSFMQRLINQGVNDNWTFACVGGEVYPPLQGTIFTGNPTSDTQNWQACVDETHASWLMCDQIKGYKGTTRDNAIAASKGLGYDLQVVTADYSELIGGDTSLPLSVTMKNNGVAPFYYDHETWPVMIGVKENGTLVKKYYTDWDLDEVAADGQAVRFDSVIVEHGLGDGTYSLCIKVRNPLRGGVLFSFANEGQGDDGWLTLGEFTVENAGEVTYEPVDDDLGPGAVAEPEPVPDGVDGKYEAENQQLEGKATLSDNYKASGGMMVGWIGTGDGESGSLYFDHIEVDEEGPYTAEIAYVLGEAKRTATIDVNGGEAAGSESVEVVFKSTGGWTTLGTTIANLNLKKGINTLRVHNDNGYAPDLDYIKLTKGYTEIEEPDEPEAPEGSGYFEGGSYADWSDVEAVYTSPAETIWMTDDDDYIYLAAKHTYSSLSHWQVMLETDGSTDSGMTSTWPFAPGGIDYMIEGDTGSGNLAYKANSNGDWEWDFTAYVADPMNALVDTVNNTIEVRIKKEALDKADRLLGNTIGAGLRYIDDDWAELGSTNGAELFYYDMASSGNGGGQAGGGSDSGSGSGEGGDAPAETFEGSLGVWDGVSPFYMDSVMSLFVTDDSDYLYLGVSGVSEDTYPHYAIEFNTDNDTSTGYQLDWIWKPGTSGSDYVVESGLLRRQTTNSTSWAPLEDVTGGLVYYSWAADKMELKIAKSKLGTADKALASTIGIGMELKDDNWVLVHSTNHDDFQMPMQTYRFLDK
ncbi:carbohydrate-binding protein [Butyrivibrio sp. MC2013]|uniref:carbohydrate-binding protein n=1 Tax=Butyrivibrio sp. MC2013 TaxID=1280686 RepID=UPI0004154FF9|nr:carbohydrate-binding protein [Butyrivibrio sp. MC2013]